MDCVHVCFPLQLSNLSLKLPFYGLWLETGGHTMTEPKGDPKSGKLRFSTAVIATIVGTISTIVFAIIVGAAGGYAKHRFDASREKDDWSRQFIESQLAKIYSSVRSLNDFQQVLATGTAGEIHQYWDSSVEPTLRDLEDSQFSFLYFAATHNLQEISALLFGPRPSADDGGSAVFNPERDIWTRCGVRIRVSDIAESNGALSEIEPDPEDCHEFVGEFRDQHHGTINLAADFVPSPTELTHDISIDLINYPARRDGREHTYRTIVLPAGLFNKIDHAIGYSEYIRECSIILGDFFVQSGVIRDLDATTVSDWRPFAGRFNFVTPTEWGLYQATRYNPDAPVTGSWNSVRSRIHAHNIRTVTSVTNDVDRDVKRCRRLDTIRGLLATQTAVIEHEANRLFLHAQEILLEERVTLFDQDLL